MAVLLFHADCSKMLEPFLIETKFVVSAIERTAECYQLILPCLKRMEQRKPTCPDPCNCTYAMLGVDWNEVVYTYKLEVPQLPHSVDLSQSWLTIRA